MLPEGKKAEIMNTHSNQESRNCTGHRSSIHITSSLLPPTSCSLISRGTLAWRIKKVTKIPFPSENINLSESKSALQGHNASEWEYFSGLRCPNSWGSAENSHSLEELLVDLSSQCTFLNHGKPRLKSQYCSVEIRNKSPTPLLF